MGSVGARAVDLLQVCEAGPDWIDGPSRKTDGGASGMAQGKEFKGRQFTAEVILWAVRWYLMFPISYRDLELMLNLNSSSLISALCDRVAWIGGAGAMTPT